MKPEVLIVDDEPDIRNMVRMLLEDEGYAVREASNAEETRHALSAKPPSLIILDIWMRQSDMDGLELQKWVKRQYPHVPTIIISGHGNIETAVQAMKDGAFDFVEKPFKSDQLLLLVERALATAKRDAEHGELKKRDVISLDIIGTSPAITHIRQSLSKIAPTNSRVLIEGGAGAGKELLARNIHAASPRQSGQFVVVNSGMLAQDQSLAELVGTEQSDGSNRLVGLLEKAHAGTLYLDGVNDLPQHAQSKLARVLRGGKFKRLGGTSEVEVDVRVISATAVAMKPLVAAGQFDKALYDALNVVHIAIPSLAERRGDIADLAKHFLAKRLESDMHKSLQFSSEAIAILEAYGWPGNIRQLRNMVDWVVIMIDRDARQITPDDLPPEISGKGGGGDGIPTAVAMPLKEAREKFEIEYLLLQLERFGGNITHTAEAVGMSRVVLSRKLKSLGIRVEDDDAQEEAGDNESDSPSRPQLRSVKRTKKRPEKRAT
ncbi:MAG: sigma-54 dependent transcriptional regulator [Proteobacteria bacterium]|nr:sigma-54 dependent transcriptional regulator [Pseudomonadota bacterium]